MFSIPPVWYGDESEPKSFSVEKLFKFSRDVTQACDRKVGGFSREEFAIELANAVMPKK